jgi:multidrug transporter EmrE-like cation transporter
MGLFFLILSGACDAIWNIYLTKLKGILDWRMNVIGVVFLIFSTLGFKKALDTMPLSVVVVVWSGLSILFTIALDMYIFKTKIDCKVAFLW